MASSTEKRLLAMAKKLRDLAQEMEDLVAAIRLPKEEKLVRPQAAHVYDEALVERLGDLGRDAAHQELSVLTHKQLGAIVRSLGGTSEEAKRSKEMIMDRILYRLFDYSAGHKIMKGETHEI